MKMIRNSIQKFRSKPLEGLVAILIGLQVISVVQNIQMVSRVNAAMAVFDGANLAQAAQILSSSKETLGVLGEVLDTNEALLGSFGVGDILSAVDKASYAVDLASQGPLAGVQELVGRTVPKPPPS